MSYPLRTETLKSIDNVTSDSPDIRPKCKLGYYDDHESDVDTPRKSDISLLESVTDTQEQDYPMNFVKEKKFIVFESLLYQLLISMLCPDKTCSSRILKIEKKKQLAQWLWCIPRVSCCIV